MYVDSIHVKNIRSIDDLNWQCPNPSSAGWHVIIGDNGAGKSTLLRAIALALIGPTSAQALRVKWSDWLRSGKKSGTMRVDLRADAEHDKWAGTGRQSKELIRVAVKLTKNPEGEVDLLAANNLKVDPLRHAWSGRPGWFAASYGPFRRFTGGDKDSEKLFYSHPRVGRHLTLFGESVALSEVIDWLQHLQFKALEAESKAEVSGDHTEVELLTNLKRFVNESRFLPHNARIERVTSDTVEFVDGNNVTLPVSSLSDGYRSILSFTFELIRQLAQTYGPTAVFSPHDPTRITLPGVVLVDEIDAHLHPSWQMQIGIWMRRHFPNLQFFVTTHSPLVCQAAANNGSVFRLAQPGSDMTHAMLQGAELSRLLYGNVVDAYDSRAFGENVGRSDLAREKMNRLAQLNQKLLETGLSEAEQAERSELQVAFPTMSATGEPTND